MFVGLGTRLSVAATQVAVIHPGAPRTTVSIAIPVSTKTFKIGKVGPLAVTGQTKLLAVLVTAPMASVVRATRAVTVTTTVNTRATFALAVSATGITASTASYLTDHNGNILTDHSGNALVGFGG